MYFVTTNPNKFMEVKAALPDIKQFKLDVEEIQSIDVDKVIREKVKSIRKEFDGSFICEDSSLEVKALKGFPGALIKWVILSLKLQDFAKLANMQESNEARAITVFGFFDHEANEEFYFRGVTKGNIVDPKGDGFGFDSCFLPENEEKTYGEMSLDEKMSLSHRAKALNSLKEHVKYHE